MMEGGSERSLVALKTEEGSPEPGSTCRLQKLRKARFKPSLEFPERNAAQPDPKWTSDLQSCKIINLYRLSCHVCSDLLWQK